MTKYNVHLYREMKLSYAGIEADTPQAAAAISRDKATGDADAIDDCDGESLSALVDEAGDEDYSQSVMIDFELERQRKAAPKLLAALLLAQEALNTAPRFRVGDTDSYKIASMVDKAIAGATGDSPSEPIRPIVIEVLGGVVQDVQNVPPGYEYEIKDYDDLNAEAEGRLE